MAKDGTPQDAFFKRLLGTPEAAATFLRERLPPEIAALLARDLPEPVPGSFVDEQDRPCQSDLLFRMRTVDGDEVFLYALVKHKRDPDPLVTIHLPRYLVRIWDRWRRERPYSRFSLRLPPIIPMVVYHDADSWTVSTAFPALVEAPAALQPNVPAFDYQLTDPGRIANDALSVDARSEGSLMALRSIFPDDLPGHLVETLVAEAVEATIELFVCTAATQHSLIEDALQAAVRCALSGQEERILSPLAERWQRGLSKGMAAGKAAALLRILTHRFGEPAEGVRAAVLAADPDTLDVWIDRALIASNLDTVLNTSPHS